MHEENANLSVKDGLSAFVTVVQNSYQSMFYPGKLIRTRVEL